MKLQSAHKPPRRPKGPIYLLIAIVILVGGTFLLSTMAKEQPVETVEVEIPVDAE